jgi:hypothetical protein
LLGLLRHEDPVQVVVLVVNGISFRSTPSNTALSDDAHISTKMTNSTPDF